ncbi:hypothetical protein LTR56_021598 [Elasticomyces elasticus]|nr:hypothetical protein LTR56_021598 [Elasticomyces elasticus]KAK3630959.1 hypothetical protein LTR22_021290 [Elasticomyces elasticus]KAK4915930.1 hypothetical protein LTR49_015965 [Elasticomyces elasticus]KAK5754045.1 hypothetical protein LTS12_015899 [Elasticomyces elasticus]
MDASEMEDLGQQQPAASYSNQLDAPWLDEDYLQNVSFEDYEAASYTFGAEAALLEEIDVEALLVDDRGCTTTAIPAHGIGLDNSGQVLHSDPAIPMSLPFLIDGLNTPVRRRLFAHFSQKTAWVLTASGLGYNPFMETYIPQSLHDITLLESLLCLAASHLSRMQASLDREVENEKKTLLEAAEDRQETQLGALALEQNDDQTLSRKSLLVSLLLLCVYEISEGAGDICWRIRLDSARRLLRPTQALSIDLTDDNFLLEFFIYHEALATATAPSIHIVPECNEEFWVSLSSSRQSNSTHMVGAYDGLLRMVTKLSNLQDRISTSGQLDGMLIGEANDLWIELDRWQPSECDTDPADSSGRQSLCQAYQSALFVWLFALMYPDRITSDRLQQAVEHGIGHLCKMQTQGGLSVSLFPAFVLGFACIRSKTREQASGIFQKLLGFSSFGNVRLAWDMLQRWWADYDSGVCEVWNWKRYLESHETSLPLT